MSAHSLFIHNNKNNNVYNEGTKERTKERGAGDTQPLFQSIPFRIEDDRKEIKVLKLKWRENKTII